MKLGDMTFKQIAEICKKNNCIYCQFFYAGDRTSCLLRDDTFNKLNLNMEVNIDAEN